MPVRRLGFTLADVRWTIARVMMVWVAGLIATAAGSARAQATSQDRTNANAQALVERLHAPCCHEQLLDGHESESARALRQEIRTRLAQGASADEVERDLVLRYGEWIVAVPKDGDPRSALSVALALTLAATALGLTVLGLRWVRRDRQRLASPALMPAGGSARQAQLDATLDAELRRMDE